MTRTEKRREGPFTESERKNDVKKKKRVCRGERKKKVTTHQERESAHERMYTGPWVKHVREGQQITNPQEGESLAKNEMHCIIRNCLGREKKKTGGAAKHGKIKKKRSSSPDPNKGKNLWEFSTKAKPSENWSAQFAATQKGNRYGSKGYICLSEKPE